MMLVPSLRNLTKAAEEPYPGFHSVATQQYAPIQGGREFSPEEEEEIAAGKSRWFPKIFKSYSTPASQLMSSPGKGALMSGLGGGVIGALGGALAGGSYANSISGNVFGRAGTGSQPGASGWTGGTLDEGADTGALIGAGVGGLGLGGIAALLAYFKRRQRNEDVEELMSRLPPGATRRDILSDPAYQKDREMRQSRSNNAALIAAMARR